MSPNAAVCIVIYHNGNVLIIGLLNVIPFFGLGKVKIMFGDQGLWHGSLILLSLKAILHYALGLRFGHGHRKHN